MTHRNTLLASSALLAPPIAFDNAETARGVGMQSVFADEMLKRSPDSAAMLDYWTLTDNIVDGADAMRLAGETYIPKFSDEDPNDYKYRLQCTKFTNVYRDIVESLAAKPFEQEVSLVEVEGKTIPDDLLKFIEDVDGSGNHITQFASLTFFNGINSAIDWIFVDFSKRDPSIVSVADAKRAGIRPFWSHVLGRNVLKATSKVINGKETLTYIKIYEPGTPDQVREFVRADNGAVTWKLYEKVDNPTGKTAFVEIDKGTVSIGVIPLVPFATGRRDGRSFRYFPAMRDAADLQLELYQDESALKWAKRLAGYPMLTGNGVRPPMQPDGKTPAKLATGPGRVLYAPPGAEGRSGSWAYVEPGAQTLKFLADDIKETISQLRELGRQPLTAQSGNLTVITAATAAGKAKSAVGAWALGLKDALENAMVITCRWYGIVEADYPQVNVYSDFDDFTDGKDLEALQGMRTNKDISRETLWSEMGRRGVLSPEFDPVTEEKRLLDELPGDGEPNVGTL